MKSLAIPSAFTTTFTLEYGVSEADMRRLYENAKRDQWNASRDISWSAPPSSDGRVIADELIDIYGSPLWERLPEADRVTLNRRIAAWRLSVRSEEHTSELQSPCNLVCRLLLEKKKQQTNII